MKIAITGHTSGIGLALYEHYLTQHTVVGYSRRNGYDISSEQSRDAIAANSIDCDIFINNAYKNFDRSQLHMLERMFSVWSGCADKTIINISTRWTHGTHVYSTTKLEQDQFCLARVGQFPKIINIKPGLTDTSRVNSIEGKRQPVSTVVSIVDMILVTGPRYGITSITFGT